MIQIQLFLLLSNHNERSHIEKNLTYMQPNNLAKSRFFSAINQRCKPSTLICNFRAKAPLSLDLKISSSPIWKKLPNKVTCLLTKIFMKNATQKAFMNLELQLLSFTTENTKIQTQRRIYSLQEVPAQPYSVCLWHLSSKTRRFCFFSLLSTSIDIMQQSSKLKPKMSN